MAELAQKYRDRARERRDGGQDQPEDPLSAASGYRAVAPDLKSGMFKELSDTLRSFFKVSINSKLL